MGLVTLHYLGSTLVDKNYCCKKYSFAALDCQDYFPSRDQAETGLLHHNGFINDAGEMNRNGAYSRNARPGRTYGFCCSLYSIRALTMPRL